MEKPEKIPKIGARKKTKTTGRTKHFVILEFENGKQLKTSELTIDMLKEIAMANNKVEEETVTDLTPGWVFQKALTDLTQNKRHQPKTLLIRQQELVALPIFTLTSGGVNVGAYYRRFFTNKPSKKFYEERYTPSNITHLKDGQVHVNRFMHWEGVEFDHLTKKSNVIGMRTVVEEIPVQGEEEEENEVEDDDEDEACSLISEILRKARKSRRAKLKLNPKHDTYDSMSFDPNSFNSNDLNNHGEFNFFEKDNPLSKALVTASPSVSAITQMINENDDNPLLSLISSTPFVSPAQLLAQVDDDRMSPFRISSIHSLSKVFLISFVLRMIPIRESPHQEPSMHLLSLRKEWKSISLFFLSFLKIRLMNCRLILRLQATLQVTMMTKTMKN